MNYLITKNNVIANIVVIDDTAFAVKIGALPYYDGAEIGDTYSPPPDLDKLRADALSRIDGYCSAAIYSGVDVNGKHYSFTQTAQGNIKGMLIEVQNGKTAFLYCADNEPLTTYTADEIKAIAQVMGEWINVNTVYYEQLKTWINRETDEAVLSTIHYGSQLPNDLMQELVTKLASVGVDITKYASMLGG